MIMILSFLQRTNVKFIEAHSIIELSLRNNGTVRPIYFCLSVFFTLERRMYIAI